MFKNAFTVTATVLAGVKKYIFFLLVKKTVALSYEFSKTRAINTIEMKVLYPTGIDRVIIWYIILYIVGANRTDGWGISVLIFDSYIENNNTLFLDSQAIFSQNI